MLIRTILYQYIKTLIKHVFLLNFTYELLMILEVYIKVEIILTVLQDVFAIELISTLI